LHVAQLMPLPLTVSCSCKIQTGFTFLVPAHSGSAGKKAVKRLYAPRVVDPVGPTNLVSDAGPDPPRESGTFLRAGTCRPIKHRDYAMPGARGRCNPWPNYFRHLFTKTPHFVHRNRSRAYSKRVPRTNCALRMKKCAPRISSGIYFISTS